MGLATLGPGLIHSFLPDGGAGVIAGMDLSGNGAAIVRVFAWAGATLIVWGLTLLAWLAFGVGGGPVTALLSAPLLAVPYVAIARLAALTARGRDVVLSDALDAIRRFGLVALAAGAFAALAFAILASNIIVGTRVGGPVGWVLSTLAAAGILVLWVYGWPFWVLLVDPERDDERIAAKVRLAALLVIAAAVYHLAMRDQTLPRFTQETMPAPPQSRRVD